MAQRAPVSFLPLRLRGHDALPVTPSTFAIAAPPHHDRRTNTTFRNFALALAAFFILPPLLLAALVIAVDPYYVFGSPSLRSFNAVRPSYEPHVLTAKPYQVWRQRPSAVALGSSRVEVGIDPRHSGWIDTDVFNFALPSSNSYAVMLAFLHAQKMGAPLKQAVLGLDFFAYNINFPIASGLAEQRFANGISDDFNAFLDEMHPDRRNSRAIAAAGTAVSTAALAWNEALYLAVNRDVAAAVAQKLFTSGHQHYDLAGRSEHREGVSVPADWDERGYLELNPDVAAAIAAGTFISGYHHYLAAGRRQKRLGGFQPADWNEATYLAANPDAQARIALGKYRSAYLHYAAVGKREGRLGGFPAVSPMEEIRLRWPALNQGLFQLDEVFHMVFSVTAMRDAIATMLRQSEPADFDGAGVRVWHGQEAVVRTLGGPGAVFRRRLSAGAWQPWLVPPKLIHCFADPDTGVSAFDPFRFMLRRAYAEGTDLRLFVTPNQAAVRTLLIALGLGERYELWLKELVRINESEALRAGRPPLPLWDFSDPNTITREPIPVTGDLTPMRWYWEYSHYRKETGDLILDRIFSQTNPSRQLPADFGVRLTADNIDAHLARSKAALDDWTTANAELASQIAAAARDPKSRSRQAEATCW